ncbi:DNA phosphorothioation-associated putative methyltransferase [Cyanobacterium sp. IPPAS B-1200]|uniref:DNA phosphorothioation-associated putative methyltransferase n=1 Tax=Cyanobacterium sp. IPPAS B-1200 TaxID=1562720 RepID=UPI00085275C3|nr:DNA phosphorothioation-associated putative methyltransferase [Cyanobacterium sp. IPPAS B-1200]OEJ78930.1 DNA phosphorothioation-associated methyltransferase [Cyanobacterium sp. IPPAS B-1200]
MTINLSLDWVNDFVKITQLARQSAIGKHLPNHLYVHISALQFLDINLQEYEKKAREIINNIDNFTLVKFNLQEPKISYLFYPDFDINPHPPIKKSILINLQEKTSKIYNYNSSQNPAILHRKETFVTTEYPYYQTFAHLTNIEERLGLLDNSKYIGTQKEWQNLLRDHNLSFIDHNLVCLLNKTEEDLYKVDRHRAAMVRNRFSRPVRLALEAGLFLSEYTFFDYGCGHGKDVEVMAKYGFQSAGWDPYYQPTNEVKPADIVNLGYIINVIENLQERRESLVKAWQLTKEILIVSAQVLVDDRQRGFMAYADGIITERNTFQKYYEQEELKIYIEQILKTEAIPAGLGVYFVFRDATKANSFRASRFHSRVRAPRVLSPLKKFADFQELLQPLMEFYALRGRSPVKGEISQEGAIKEEFGSFKRAFKVILQVTQEEEWEAIADQRRQDILLYLALSRFEKRPTIRQLSAPLKEDIKALFGNYQAACFLADEMLISLRNLEIIKQICQKNCPVGKVFEKSFLVHINELDNLPTLLRLYEGCASRTIGRMEGATLIRFYFNIPQIGYLNVAQFDTEKEPLVQANMTINLSDLRVRYQNFNLNQAPRIKDKEKLINKSQ